MAIVKLDMTLPDEVTAKPTSVSIMGAGVYNNVSLNIADATLKTGEEGAITIDTEGLALNGHSLTVYAALYPNDIKAPRHTSSTSAT